MHASQPATSTPPMPGGGVYGRSARREVRNPVLALPAARRILMLPTTLRTPLAILLRDLAREADRKAESAWLGRKGVIAAYWRAVCTYAKHLARAIGPRADEPSIATTNWMPIPAQRDLEVAPWDGAPWLIGRPGHPPIVAQFLPENGVGGRYWWHFEPDAQAYGHYQDPTHFAPIFPIPGDRA